MLKLQNIIYLYQYKKKSHQQLNSQFINRYYAFIKLPHLTLRLTSIRLSMLCEYIRVQNIIRNKKQNRLWYYKLLTIAANSN